MKKIELSLTDYVVKGVSDLTHWGGGNACIEMDQFHIKSLTLKNLLQNINDAGFGVEAINGAICEIYENYQGYLRYFKTIKVGRVSEYTERTHAEIF